MNASRRGVERRRKGSAGGTPEPSGLKARAEDSKAEIKSEAGGGSPLSCTQWREVEPGIFLSESICKGCTICAKRLIKGVRV